MITIIADLRGIGAEFDVADHPCRAELEGLLHRFAGQVIRIKVSVVRKKDWPIKAK